MDFKKDYYHILELERRATKEDIKASYRNLAKLHHPDKNPGDETAPERFREVQESYDILFNDITRNTYDTYRDEAEKIKAREEQDSKAKEHDSPPEKPKVPRKKTYTKKTTVKVPKHIYVSGTIRVKYWGDLEEDTKGNSPEEVSYKIHPTAVEAIIEETSIFAINLPKDLERIYTEAKLFYTPVPQPIHCTILTEAGEEKYDLTIHDLKVIDPVLSDIVKYEKQSLGTLKGTFYGYVVFEKEEEIIEEVTEFSGETGFVETKAEKNVALFRKQYYHADGTTFWGAWQRSQDSSGGGFYSSHGSPSSVPNQTNAISDDGCAILLFSIPIILLLILAPQVFVTIIGVVALWLVIVMLAVISQSFLRIVLLSIVIFSFIVFFEFSPASPRKVEASVQNHYDSVSTRTQVASQDTLVQHHLQWMDVDSNKYAMEITVPLSGIRMAEDGERQLLWYHPRNIQSVYTALENMAPGSLDNVYANYDSIRAKNALSRYAYASMVVSSIQSLPYYLVLEEPCNSANIKSAFARQFLSTCRGDCCVGDVPFGVRAPVAFFRDLKGDCDTRVLLLYHLFRKAGYEVAVLVSEVYHHAMLGIALPDAKAGGFSMLVKGKRYYFWETTSRGFSPGEIPAGLQNLEFWEIALINRNN